jgi:hypothetical protein
MRRSAWIWAAGCIVWTTDGLINLRNRNLQHAQLDLLLAIMFGIAFAFYRQQKR